MLRAGYGRHASHFYPRSPYGERRNASSGDYLTQDFYPRSPYGERRAGWPSLSMRSRFLSTLSLRRATVAQDVVQAVFAISIHALLTESDLICGGWWQCDWIFLSTLSLRRATPVRHCTWRTRAISIHALHAGRNSQHTDFYPRSPYGERLEEVSGDTWMRDFYPRSPYGERLGRAVWPGHSF